VLGDPVEVLRDVDRGDAQLGGLGDQIGGVGGGLVGVVSRRTEYLFGELTDRLDDHLLVVVGGQVEVVGPTRAQAGGLFAQALDLLELPGGGAGGGEGLLDAVLQTPVEGVAKVVAVQELLAQQGSDERQADVGGRALVLVGADGAVAGAGAFRLGRKGVGHIGSLIGGGRC
jgi:hypothetical protein